MTLTYGALGGTILWGISAVPPTSDHSDSPIWLIAFILTLTCYLLDKLNGSF